MYSSMTAWQTSVKLVGAVIQTAQCRCRSLNCFGLGCHKLLIAMRFDRAMFFGAWGVLPLQIASKAGHSTDPGALPTPGEALGYLELNRRRFSRVLVISGNCDMGGPTKITFFRGTIQRLWAAGRLPFPPVPKLTSWTSELRAWIDQNWTKNNCFNQMCQSTRFAGWFWR